MSQRKTFLSLACAAFLLVLNAATSAQSIWLDRSLDRALWLEIQKPDFTKKYLGGGVLPHKTTFATSALFLSTRWRVSGPLVLRAEIPFVNAGFKDQTFNDSFGNPVQIDGGSENLFGNPCLGIELGRADASSFGEIGIRFPIVDDEHLFSSEFGTYTDFDRFEAFLPHLWTFTGVANLQYKGRTGLLLRFRTGPAFFVPTESGADPELFADYSAQAGYQADKLTVLGGITGRAILTESHLNFDERTVHQLGLNGSYAFDHFIPGVHFRVPLDDDFSNIVLIVFGFSVGYRLP